MKKVFAIFLALSLVFLCGCGDRNKKTAKEFILCIEEQRFEDAVALMHPECLVTSDEISSYFALLEKDSGVEFFGDFKLEECETEEFEDTEATVSGEHIKATGIVRSGGMEFTFDIKLAENDKGYGIYKIKFRAKE